MRQRLWVISPSSTTTLLHPGRRLLTRPFRQPRGKPLRSRFTIVVCFCPQHPFSYVQRDDFLSYPAPVVILLFRGRPAHLQDTCLMLDLQTNRANAVRAWTDPPLPPVPLMVSSLYENGRTPAGAPSIRWLRLSHEYRRREVRLYP